MPRQAEEVPPQTRSGPGTAVVASSSNAALHTDRATGPFQPLPVLVVRLRGNPIALRAQPRNSIAPQAPERIRIDSATRLILRHWRQPGYRRALPRAAAARVRLRQHDCGPEGQRLFAKCMIILPMTGAARSRQNHSSDVRRTVRRCRGRHLPRRCTRSSLMAIGTPRSGSRSPASRAGARLPPHARFGRIKITRLSRRSPAAACIRARGRRGERTVSQQSAPVPRHRRRHR